MNTRTALSTSASRLSTGRPLRVLVATVCVAFAATLAQTALAQPAGGPGAAHHGGHAMGRMAQDGTAMGHHGKHGMARDGGRWMGRMLDLVAATPEQRAKIQAITETARNELRGQREAGRKLKMQSQALLAQPRIDANAAEAVRQQMLVLHDQTSRRRLQMRLDVAAVLTPEQRKTLGDRMAQRQAMMERHRAERAQADGVAPR